ncbi:MAG: dihydrofolate reductase family protein [Bacteroidota bacterium]|nr:dihydrofolate reductase family protein [Bacteroidota bacterium]
MKSIVYIGTSLDGFIARNDGDFDWLAQFANDEAIRAYEELINRIDAIVMGRGTFEKVLSFPSWPYDKKVFVLSASIQQVPDMLREKVSVLSMKPAGLLSFLSGEGFSNIYIDGGKVIQSFLQEDLVDELIVSKAPVLIGSGIPLFGYLAADVSFNHIRTEVQSNGLVRSYYERNRK